MAKLPLESLRVGYRYLRNTVRMLGILFDQYTSKYRQADVAIFHQFHTPPYGGGNQFLLALWKELEHKGIRMENNKISATTRACLFNSYNFDFERLYRLRQENCLMIHRVDGPITMYRGRNDNSDYRIWQINQELADKTIFQSHYSLEEHLKLGFEFVSPSVIINCVDDSIFHNRDRVPFDCKRKIRLISVSWSDNPNKGAKTYKWIEDHLNWDRFKYTFVGRSPIQFERIKTIPPIPSEQLAELLRHHDIFITASRHDPCSNALIEALSCGLPAIYFKSGGHPEIVRKGGLVFNSENEILDILDQLVDRYECYQTQINLPSLSEITDKYLKVMGITE